MEKTEQANQEGSTACCDCTLGKFLNLCQL